MLIINCYWSNLRQKICFVRIGLQACPRHAGIGLVYRMEYTIPDPSSGDYTISAFHSKCEFPDDQKESFERAFDDRKIRVLQELCVRAVSRLEVSNVKHNKLYVHFIVCVCVCACSESFVKESVAHYHGLYVSRL